MARILIIGSGGREYCLTTKLSSSPKVSDIIICPGNGGTQILSKNKKNIKNIILDSDNDIISFVKQKKINLVVVGPEQYLANGIIG